MHKSFMETVVKFQPRVEARFGQLWFKTETVRNSVGATNEVKFVLLTKPQAEVYMTFSRNTDQVIECKLDLVQAFNEAEQSPIQPQPTPIQQTLADVDELVKWIAKTDTEQNLLEQAKYDAVASIHPEYRPLLEAAKKVRSTEAIHQSVGMTATEVGKRLNPPLKPTEVNEILESLDFQFKQPKKKRGKDSYVWQLTEEGKQHGFVYFATQADKWSGDQIRWQDSVVAVIQDYLEQAA